MAMDGGPAFPCEHTNERLQQELIAARNGGASLSFFDIRKLTSLHPGMSLRDYAAIHADISKVEFPDVVAVSEWMGEDAPRDFFGCLEMEVRAQAKLRYILADAMLAAREVRS